MQSNIIKSEKKFFKKKFDVLANNNSNNNKKKLKYTNIKEKKNIITQRMSRMTKNISWVRSRTGHKRSSGARRPLTLDPPAIFLILLV